MREPNQSSLLPLVEHDLQSADGEGEQAEAVFRRCLPTAFARFCEIRRVFHDAMGEQAGR